MRDRESKDLPVKFFFALYKLEELDDNFYGNSYVINILSVGKIKYLLPTLDLAC